MSMLAICQRCGKSHFYWAVTQASFHVGAVQNWKVNLCEDCTKRVADALQTALAADAPSAQEKP